MRRETHARAQYPSQGNPSPTPCNSLDAGGRKEGVENMGVSLCDEKTLEIAHGWTGTTIPRRRRSEQFPVYPFCLMCYQIPAVAVGGGDTALLAHPSGMSEVIEDLVDAPGD